MSVLKGGTETAGRTLRSRFVYCVLRLQRDCRLPHHHHHPPSHHEQRHSLIFPFLLTALYFHQYQNEPDLRKLDWSISHFNITRLTCSIAHELFVAVDMIPILTGLPSFETA